MWHICPLSALSCHTLTWHTNAGLKCTCPVCRFTAKACTFQHRMASIGLSGHPDQGIDWTATLQARAQSQLLGQLLPMVAQLPSAQARCNALARIWSAAVASDLDTRRAVRTRQKTLPGAELKQLLSDTFAMEVISGSSEGQ